MIVVIPLGGVGKRFSDLGYTDPKPLIKVLGKEIIFWVLDNLNIKKRDKLYIVYNNQLEKFGFETNSTNSVKPDCWLNQSGSSVKATNLIFSNFDWR